jgi:ATP-dependent Clp protease protease subunit
MNYQKEFRDFAVKGQGISSLTLESYRKSITTPMGMTPSIIEERQLNVTQMDVFSRLMMERIIFLSTEINDQVSSIIQAQLLFLDSVDNKKNIQIFVLSGGGSVYSGLAIVDTMQFVNSKVSTTCNGIAASMASVIICAGEKGLRYALPHSRIMIHQPMGGNESGTQASDMEITVKQINTLKKELYTIISECTGQDIKKVTKDSDRDYWMTAQEAKEYGMIDEVIQRRKKS